MDDQRRSDHPDHHMTVGIPPARVVRKRQSWQSSSQALHSVARRVPRTVAFHLLFGSPVGWLGWMVIVLCLVLAQQRFFGDHKLTAVAAIEQIDDSTPSTGGPPYLLHLRFVDDQGVEHQIARLSRNLDPVIRHVEYSRGNADDARLRTRRPNGMRLLALLAGLVFGSVLASAQYRRGRTLLHELRHCVTVLNTRDVDHDPRLSRMLHTLGVHDGAAYHGVIIARHKSILVTRLPGHAELDGEAYRPRGPLSVSPLVLPLASLVMTAVMAVMAAQRLGL
jgi:hypothetical protein